MTLRLLSSAQKNSLAQKALNYQNQLYSPGGEHLYEYLKGRGLTPQTIGRFQLGAVVEPEDGEADVAVGRISLPYQTPTGPVAIRYRAGPDYTGKTKYWQPPGSQSTIYNTPVITKGGDHIVITEGEIDCIIANQCGFDAVGLPGTDGWRDVYPMIFAGYQHIVLVGDNDDKGAGAEHVNKVAEALSVLKGLVHIVMMPEGHDLNSFYLAHGQDAVRELLDFERKKQ